LFIAMMLAAARAAVSASGDSFGANSLRIALVTLRSREARAQAMKVPALKDLCARHGLKKGGKKGAK
jgi:hypothetical protein